MTSCEHSEDWLNDSGSMFLGCSFKSVLPLANLFSLLESQAPQTSHGAQPDWWMPKKSEALGWNLGIYLLKNAFQMILICSQSGEPLSRNRVSNNGLQNAKGARREALWGLGLPLFSLTQPELFLPIVSVPLVETCCNIVWGERVLPPKTNVWNHWDQKPVRMAQLHPRGSVWFLLPVI